jgi:hypothetical protein
VVLMRFYRGLTSGEIATALQAPEGTVRWRLKAGVDELRRRLDQEHGGRRDEWLRGLAPLLGAAGAGTSAPRAPAVRATAAAGETTTVAKVAILCLATLLLGTGFWVARSRRTPTLAEKGAGAGGTAGHSAPGAGGSAQAARGGGGAAVGFLAAGVPASLDACALRLASVRARLVATLPDFMATATPPSRFHLGAPNPAAVAALAPALARTMKGDEAASPDYTLECRTWGCRMKVLQPSGQSANAWMQPLQRDPEIKERLHGISFRSGRLTKDPLSGATFAEYLVYLGLADPSGKRLPLALRGTTAEPTAAIPGPPTVPVTAAACGAELAAAEQMLASMTTAIERDLPPKPGWDQGQPNPPLTAEMDALVRKNLGLPPATSDVSVECRGQVCRVQANRQAFPDLGAFDQKLMTPELRRRAESVMVVSGVNYYRMASAGAVNGIDLTHRMFEELRASPALRRCEREHLPTGRIDVQISVSNSEREPDDEPDPFTLHFGGGLAGTPFGRCLEAVLSSILAHTPVPPLVTGALHTERLDFPRAPR